MEQSGKNNRSVVLVSLCLVLVVAGLIVAFLMGRPAEREEAIVLPGTQSEGSDVQGPEQGQESDFIQVTDQNVTQILRSIQQPGYSHQIFTVKVGTGDAQTQRTVELWISDRLVQGEIRGGNRIKTVLTDGKTAWFWYDTDQTPASVALSEALTVEDLLGLPAFDFLQSIERDTVLDADYLMLRDVQIQTVFVSTGDGESLNYRYWVDLSNGLLYKADALENNQPVYEVLRQFGAILVPSDETFRGKFILPDGSDPFASSADH